MGDDAGRSAAEVDGGRALLALEGLREGRLPKFMCDAYVFQRSTAVLLCTGAPADAVAAEAAAAQAGRDDGDPATVAARLLEWVIRDTKLVDCTAVCSYRAAPREVGVAPDYLFCFDASAAGDAARARLVDAPLDAAHVVNLPAPHGRVSVEARRVQRVPRSDVAVVRLMSMPGQLCWRGAAAACVTAWGYDPADVIDEWAGGKAGAPAWREAGVVVAHVRVPAGDAGLRRVPRGRVRLGDNYGSMRVAVTPAAIAGRPAPPTTPSPSQRRRQQQQPQQHQPQQQHEQPQRHRVGQQQQQQPQRQQQQQHPQRHHVGQQQQRQQQQRGPPQQREQQGHERPQQQHGLGAGPPSGQDMSCGGGSSSDESMGSAGRDQRQERGRPGGPGRRPAPPTPLSLSSQALHGPSRTGRVSACTSEPLRR